MSFAILFGAFAGIYFSTQRGLIVLLDNIHWTVSYAAAAWLAWIGVRTADAASRPVRRWFAVGLSAYAFGQLLWDIQVATGWNPFPGPSDFFYLWLGPCCAAGFLSALRVPSARGQLRTAVLDAGALSVAVLVLTLSLYLPRRGDTGIWPLTVMVAYPTGLLTAACIGLILVPTLRVRAGFGWIVFLCALIVNGGLWMQWNSLTLDNALQDGSLLNAMFSVVAMAMGLGAMTWQTTFTVHPKWERHYEGMLRQLPLLVVICAAIAVVLALTLPNMSPAVNLCIGAGAVVVAALALARQSLLLVERDQLLKAKQESEERFRTLVENAPEAIVVLDVERKSFDDVNENACRLFKLSRSEIMAKGPVELSPPFQPDGRSSAVSAMEKIQQAIAGQSLRFEWIHRDSQGLDFPCEIYLTRLPASSRTLIRGSIINITDRRNLEEHLRQSQKMESFGQLAGGVAHDFNNILAVIQIQAGLLRMEPGLSTKHIESAREIEKASQRAANLTRQLLLFSRKQTLQTRDLDLNEVVTNVTKMLQRIVGEDIAMQLNLAPGTLGICADAGMMDQVLLNLAVNARDAMPKGGQLNIETSGVELDELAAKQFPQARPGLFACVSVRDTGCGISAEVLPRIFEPFFTTKDVGKGTGLGLATVFGIMQQHHGWINVESAVDHGTTFQIYLPRLPKNQELTTERVALTVLPRGHETILLVEDDSVLRAAVRTILTELGYRIVEAASGVGALTAWQQQHMMIDLLLTDLVMPGGMSGKELGQRLLAENPNLKIIYTSGYSNDSVGKDFQPVDGVNFLSKPFQTHQLAQIVRARLDLP